MLITNGHSPFWDPMEVGLRKAAQEVGADASWDGPMNATVADQKSLVEKYASQGYDGIGISSIEAAPMVPVIDRLVSRGIKVITLDSDTPGSKRIAYIGTNNFKAGQEAGRAAMKLMPGGGTFVAFVGNQSAQNARERIDGFKDAVKGRNITVTDVMDDQKDPVQARRNVENVIQSRGAKVTGLLGVYSYNGPAIAEAVSTVKARDRYKIVVFDAEPKTLQELEAGYIDATVVQKPYEFGYQSVKLLAALIRDGEAKARQALKVPSDGIIDTGVEVVTPATVKDFCARLKALGVKSS
jgi:ribose transport system substrate-binding protein